MLIEQGFTLLTVRDTFLHQATNGINHHPTFTKMTRHTSFTLNSLARNVQEKQVRPTYTVEMLVKFWHAGLDYFFFCLIMLLEKFRSLQVHSDDLHN